MQKYLSIVDDDVIVRDALSALFMIEGFTVDCFEDGVHFLSTARTRIPACVILDVQMPNPSGLEVLRTLREQGFPSPVIMIAEEPDIGTAVQAIKYGAYDFIVKPFDVGAFVQRVREASNSFQPENFEPMPSDISLSASDVLTPREYEVLKLITGGASNKETGRQLGISPRTVEVHRARIMEKLGAKNAADLVRIVLTGEQRKAS
jgi:FixJ family two-component response regulator